MNTKILIGLITFIFSLVAFATPPPTLIFKNQQGEQTNAKVIGGNFVSAGVAPANTIFSNISSVSGVPIGNTYSAVGAKLSANQILVGFTAGPGVVSSADTTIQALQKLAGNVAVNEPAITSGADAQTILTSFNSLLTKLINAHLMAAP